MTLALLTGATFGTGLLCVARGIFPPRRSLAQALGRLARSNGSAPFIMTPSKQTGWTMKLGNPAFQLLTSLGFELRSLRGDLRILDRPLERHLAEKVALAILGFTLPVATSALMALGDVSVPWVAPLSASLILAVGGFFVPDLGIHADAMARRRDFRHALGSFLDLVVISLAGGGGVEGALYAAAHVGDNWAFVHIRQALDAARLRRESAWDALGRLGAELGVAELTELAASVGLAGTEGARVRQSLAAKAASLRMHQLSDAETEAQAATERMSLPVVLLFAGFLIFVGFPAIARVVTNLGPGS